MVSGPFVALPCAAIKLPVTLQPDERVVYSSGRGGTAHHSGWWWLAAVAGGLQVCNAPMWLVINPADITGSARFLVKYARCG